MSNLIIGIKGDILLYMGNGHMLNLKNKKMINLANGDILSREKGTLGFKEGKSLINMGFGQLMDMRTGQIDHTFETFSKLGTGFHSKDAGPHTSYTVDQATLTDMECEFDKFGEAGDVMIVMPDDQLINMRTGEMFFVNMGNIGDFSKQIGEKMDDCHSISERQTWTIM